MAVLPVPGSPMRMGLLQALVGVLARLRLHFLASSQFLDGLVEFLLRHAHVLQHFGGGAVDGERGFQYVFERHVLVAVLLRHVFGLHQHFVCLAAQVGFTARDLRQRANLRVHCLLDECGVESQLLENEVYHLLAHLQHSAQQVLGLDGLLALLLHSVHCLLYGLLGLDGKFVQVHILVSFLFVFYLRQQQKTRTQAADRQTGAKADKMTRRIVSRHTSQSLTPRVAFRHATRRISESKKVKISAFPWWSRLFALSLQRKYVEL